VLRAFYFGHVLQERTNDDAWFVHCQSPNSCGMHEVACAISGPSGDQPFPRRPRHQNYSIFRPEKLTQCSSPKLTDWGGRNRRASQDYSSFCLQFSKSKMG
jgi:hypothetical protein